MKGRAHLLRLCLPALLLSCVAAAACTKTEGTSSGTTSNTGTVSTTTPSGSAATAAPDASPIAADTTTGTTPTGGADGAAPTASAAAVASGASGAAPKASSNAATTAAAAECGTKPLPDCPLQAWMKANTNPAIAANDLPALATALDKTAGFAPAGYGNWASIAKDGAKAAKAGDMTAAKASCRTCHDQYKDKYKKDTALRARKI